MPSLVYMYGCAPPTRGLDHVRAEHERCMELWDRLVEIERESESEQYARAAADVPEIAEINTDIGRLTARLESAPTDAAARAERRKLYAARKDLMRVWRKDHRQEMKEIDRRRQAAVTEARQKTTAWWPNYNMILKRYETGRQINMRFGRRLRPNDPAREALRHYTQYDFFKTDDGSADVALEHIWNVLVGNY